MVIVVSFLQQTGGGGGRRACPVVISQLERSSPRAREIFDGFSS